MAAWSSRELLYTDKRYGCSCTGVIIALIVIGILITLPSILGGTVIFVGFMDNPFLYLLSFLSLYAPLVLVVLVVWFVLNRRGKNIPE
jgi:fumarate reductase subunit C